MAEAKKIMIVEDDELIRNMYKTKLEADGYTVAVVDNGGDAIPTVKAEKPDLVLLDVILPQLDGFTVLEELKSMTEIKDTPVIMLTNLGTEEDIEKGNKMGAVDYIVKANFTPAQVSEQIKNFFNKN